ncbi:MAG: hypothetical protein IKM54_06520 [Butyricicoccus sp.]|nr:hypothetical protein [Butyricicoccus sp.]
MTDPVFPRWRLTLTALFLGAELLWLTQRPLEAASAVPTLLLAAAVLFPSRTKGRWLLTLLPALWLLVCCVLRLSELFTSCAMTALHPALCGLAFVLAAVQLARHGRATLYQWSWPTAWLIGAGCALAVLLGWPEIDDLWFLLLTVSAELARCAALTDLLR